MSKWFLFLLGSFLLCCAPVRANVVDKPGSTIPLPDLPEPTQNVASLLSAQNGSLRFKSALDGTYFSVMRDFNNENGAPLVLDLATRRISDTTLGWLVSSKPNQTETVMNLGWRFGLNQQLLFSAAQLRELVDAGMDGKQNFSINQRTGGLNYRYFLDTKWITGIEWSGYASSSPSQSAGVEDAFQRIAGSNLYGIRLGVETSPLPDAKLHIGFGGQRLSYDSISSTDLAQSSVTGINTSIKWSQILLPTLRYNASMETNGVERNLSTGLDFNWRDGHQLGVKLARTQSLTSNDRQATEDAIKFAYTYQFGKKFAPFYPQTNKAPWGASLIPEVLERPDYLPDFVLAKPESSVN